MTCWEADRVQVPLALGRVIPQMFSRRDDFPVLCEPMTAIMGISMSIETLPNRREPPVAAAINTTRITRNAPGPVEAVRDVKHAPPCCRIAPRIGDPRGLDIVATCATVVECRSCREHVKEKRS